MNMVFVVDAPIPIAFVIRVEVSPMATCDRCGRHENLPYNCRRCGGVFCGTHRLPENHDCPGLEDWNDPSGVFDSGFDDSVRYPEGQGRSASASRFRIDTGPGGPLSYFRKNMTYVFLALMWTTFFLQLVTQSISAPLMRFIFVLEPGSVLHVWTWVTSIFAHGGFGHIVVNSIVLYFFGPIVERRMGSRDFTILFIASGIAAGLSQILVGIAIGQPGPGVVGASGAILAVMGVLTVLNPNLRVLLFFIVPMPLWLLTLGFAAVSVFVMVGAGLGAGGIAHLAHLVGLVFGLVWGEKLRREGTQVPDQLRFGGGPGGGFGGPGRRF